MSWLDTLFNAGYTTVLIAGVALPQQRSVNIVAGATGANNIALGRTDLTLTGGAPSGAAGGDLGGTYPNPTVQGITGTSGNDFPIAVDGWVEHAPTASPNANVATRIVSVTTTDNATSVAIERDVVLNGVQRWAATITATHAGDGTGLGNVVDSWTATATVRMEPDNVPTPELLASNVSAAECSSGWAGPTWTQSATALQITVQGAVSAGTIHWTVDVRIVEAT